MWRSETTMFDQRLDQIARELTLVDADGIDELIEEAAGILADPRTAEEIDLDTWQAEWYDTYRSLRNDMR